MKRSLIIGSRGSKLALTQTQQAQAQLLQLNPELDIRIEIIKTTGDVKSDPLSVIGGKGVFTKELEEALLDGRIDLAVHSLKDLPTILPDGLSITAICEREDPRDALVLRADLNVHSLSDLPDGFVIGTSSPRRLAQLKHLRSTVLVKELRGNVDTRLRKLDEGQYDALILATAGLKRLGLQNRITHKISTDEMLPAVGQGAIAIETLASNNVANAAITKLDHEPTRAACTAERSFLRSLGGGCQLPIAAHAVVDEHIIRLEGLVTTVDGSEVLRDSASGSLSEPEEVGERLARTLIEAGATSLLN